MNLVPVTYKGGIYRHDEIMDLIEDLGGYIIQKHVLAQEVVLQALVPREDIELIARVGKPLTGEITPSPLVGTEIAVVTMSLEIHHLPHASCDVAEYVRRMGAKTNMVGLARGFGKRIAQLNDEERDVINEHDLAVYLLGDFETCIEHKFPILRRGIHVPIIVLGGPSTETLMRIIDPPVDGYVGNGGRFMHRTKESEELEMLDQVVTETEINSTEGENTQSEEDTLEIGFKQNQAELLDKVHGMRFQFQAVFFGEVTDQNATEQHTTDTQTNALDF